MWGVTLLIIYLLILYTLQCLYNSLTFGYTSSKESDVITALQGLNTHDVHVDDHDDCTYYYGRHAQAYQVCLSTCTRITA